MFVNAQNKMKRISAECREIGPTPGRHWQGLEYLAKCDSGNPGAGEESAVLKGAARRLACVAAQHRQRGRVLDHSAGDVVYAICGIMQSVVGITICVRKTGKGYTFV